MAQLQRNKETRNLIEVTCVAYLYSGVQILIGLCKLQQVRAFKLKYFSSHSEKWKQMRWIMSPLTTNNEGGANMKYHLIWLWCGLMLLYLLLWDAISSPACSANVLNNATFGHINIHMFSCIIRSIFFPKDLNHQKVIAPEQVLDGQEESKRNTN